MYKLLFGCLIIFPLLLSNMTSVKVEQFDKSEIDHFPIAWMLKELGNPVPSHYMEKYDEDKALIGESLIYSGYAMTDGKKSKRISPYFVCTDCHNLVPEFDKLNGQNPEDRLDNSIKKGIPFMPGSTFYGIYNRSTFYNGDYVRKYGDAVINARDTLSNAVQVCAKYCSAGRYLEDWELEAIMHWFKKNELHMSDLELTPNQKKNLLKYQQLDANEKQELSKVINDQLVGGYDATFLPAMPREERKYGEGGDAERGEVIYEKSCLHCHLNKRVTYMHLDHDKLSARMFWRNRKNYSDKSLYQIIRYGTYSKKGRQQYMPLYTKEKMSDKQLNDLFAYIKELAGK